MPNNPRHLPSNHPVRELLTAAANGRTVTNADIDRLKAADAMLPPGQSLSRFALDVAEAAHRVKATTDTGSHGLARQEAEQLWGDLAARMRDDERALDADPNPEPMADITARMFNH